MVMNIFLSAAMESHHTFGGKHTFLTKRGIQRPKVERTPSAQNAASSTVSRMIVITEANSSLKCKQALNVTVYLGEQS